MGETGEQIVAELWLADLPLRARWPHIRSCPLHTGKMVPPERLHIAVRRGHIIGVIVGLLAALIAFLLYH